MLIIPKYVAILFIGYYSYSIAHSDAIEKILERVPLKRRDDVILLDPKDKDYAFGIFLIKYLHNILYPLIENPGSTLSDIEIMLTNKPFREHLLSNMKYNADAVRRFWHDQFDALSKQAQERQLESTFNRISLLNPLYCDDLQDPWKRELVFEQTRDVFAKLEILFGKSEEKLGVFLIKYLHNILYPLIENPGSTLSDIEIMLTNKPFREHLLSNMKYNADAVRRFWHDQFDALSKQAQERQLESTFNRISLFQRQYVREIISQPKPTIDFDNIMDERKIVLLNIPISLNEESRSFIGALFISQLLKAIFLRADKPEQERVPFAIYCDEFHNFATPDFAKLFAQTRKFKIMPTVAHQYRDQFKPGDPGKGATLASPNKVHFRLTEPDAGGFAREAHKKPPTEIKRERELVISHYPVRDLLEGHANPEIRQFVNRYLRPMQERSEDIKEEMEGRKLIRMGLMDESGVSRLEAQMLGRGSNETELTKAQEAIARSFYETNALQGLHFRSQNLKQATRSFDRFLTATMEGQIAPGQEQFSNFLIEQTENFSGISEKQKQMLKLYIQLRYGGAMVPRAIPFDLAEAHGLFLQTISGIRQDIEKKRAWEKRQYLKDNLDDYLHFLTKDRATDVKKEIVAWKVEGDYAFTKERLLVNYLFLHHNPALQTLLKPFYTSRFAPSWQAIIKNTDDLIQDRCRELSGMSEASEKFIQERRSPGEKVFVKESLIADLKEFLRRFREGAFVVFSLLWVARAPTYFQFRYNEPGDDIFYHYSDLNMLCLPAIVGKEPLEIFLLIKKLGDIMLAQQYLFCWDEVPGNDSARLREFLKQEFGTSGLFDK